MKWARVAVAIVVATMTISAARAVGAETAPDEGPPAAPVIDPGILTAAVDLARTTRQLAEVEEQITAASQKLASAQSALAVFEGFVATSAPGLERARERVRADAVTAYTNHSAASGASLTVSRGADVGRADHYLSAATVVDSATVQRLADLQRDLEQLRADGATLRNGVSEAVSQLQASKGRLVDLRTKQQKELDAFGAVPVMGKAWLTAAQLAAWFRSTGTVPQLAPGTSIDDLAAMYIDEGQAEGVRGDLAFAQAIVESGYFTVTAGNNYSGIGACDSCVGGLPFADPREGVRAQIQLLRNYADPDSRAANLAHPPEPGLYGPDPEHAHTLYDTFFLKGKAPLWNQMGNGNWATDPLYAGKVISLFAWMLVFTQRGAPA